MAKQKTPAYLRLETNSHHNNKEDLEKMIKREEQLRGDNNLIHDPPETLSEIGKGYYLFIVKQLDKNKVLSNLDIPMVEQAADCLDKMQIVDDILNEDGMFIQARDSKGNEFLKEHPAVKTKMQYLNQFRFLSGQLGMSPSSRAQMAQADVEAKVEEAKPLNELMKKKNQNRA